MGVGAFPCDDWLSGDNKKLTDGLNWIGGFWSGLNFTPSNKNVGKAAGATEIFKAVRRYCLAHTSETLSYATAQVYMSFLMEQK